METPTLSHLNATDFDKVYEPAEDSFLLIDALEIDLSLLVTFRPLVCMEIGSGSGVVITALAKSLQKTCCLAVDINPTACQTTRRTAQANDVVVDAINADLVGALRDGSVDLLVCNPPYVPTPSEEVSTPGLSQAWAGGVEGREVVDRLLPSVARILSPAGRFYLLALAENRPEDIKRYMERRGFVAKTVKERRIRGTNSILHLVDQRGIEKDFSRCQDIPSMLADP